MKEMRYPFLGRGMKDLRISKGFTKQQVVETLTVSLRTLERIENGENAHFSSIFELLQLYEATPYEVACIFSFVDPVNELFECKTEDHSALHILRLKTYENMHYNCYYINTQKTKGNFVHFTLQTSHIDMRGYLLAKAFINGYEYIGRIESPVGNDYTYLYLTSTGLFSESAFAIFPFNSKVKTNTTASCGRILSLSSDRQQYPCYQKILMLSTAWEIPDENMLNNALARFLTFQNDDEYNQYKFCSYELLEEDTQFTRWVNANLKSRN